VGQPDHLSLHPGGRHHPCPAHGLRSHSDVPEGFLRDAIRARRRRAIGASKDRLAGHPRVDRPGGLGGAGAALPRSRLPCRERAHG
jgi:hypothetical protein